jgi:hypothetical protein
MSNRLFSFLTALTIVVALAGCSESTKSNLNSDGPNPDGDGGCPGDQILLYAEPGCGTSAVGVCGGPAVDACAEQLCGCEGTTIIGCGVATQPFAARGPCP